jgi:hypothetical protein
VFTYRLHAPDGDDLGEAAYLEPIKVGELIHFRGGERLRVLDVVAFEQRDEAGLAGMLTVEAA